MSSLSAGFRLVRAGWVLVREGVVAALPGDQLSGLPKLGWRVATMFTRRRALKQDRSDRLAHAVARLGPSYVKLGQFLATRPDVVGNDIALELALLQDKMPTFPRAEAQAAIEASLGRTTGDLYLEFGDAVAAASIAQVHPAEIDYPQGRRKVAVKVIRPGVRRRFLQDLESYFLAARLQEKYIPSSRRLRPVQVTETLAQTTRIEMDLRLEGTVLERQHRLDETRHAGCGLEVAEVGLDRTNGKPRISSLAIDLTDGGGLDRVANGCAGSMRLHEVDIGRGEPAFGKHAAHELRLPGPTGDGDASLARAIGIDACGADDGLDVVTVGERLIERLEQEHGPTLGTHIAIASRIERFTAPIGGEHRRLREAHEGIRMQEHVDATDQRRSRLTGLKRHAGMMQRDERRRARGVDRKRRAVQVEHIRQTIRGHAERVARHRVRSHRRQVVEAPRAVIKTGDANVSCTVRTGKGGRRDLGVLHGLPRELEEQTLLRIEPGRLARRNTEKPRIELIDA